jgi:hypothetical protein
VAERWTSSVQVPMLLLCVEFIRYMAMFAKAMGIVRWRTLLEGVVLSVAMLKDHAVRGPTGGYLATKPSETERPARDDRHQAIDLRRWEKSCRHSLPLCIPLAVLPFASSKSAKRDPPTQSAQPLPLISQTLDTYPR